MLLHRKNNPDAWRGHRSGDTTFPEPTFSLARGEQTFVNEYSLDIKGLPVAYEETATRKIYSRTMNPATMKRFKYFFEELGAVE